MPLKFQINGDLNMKKITMLALCCAAAMNFSYAANVAYNHAGDFYMPLSFGWYAPDSDRGLNSDVAGGIGVGYNFNNYLAAETNAFFFGLPQTNNTNVVTPGYLWDVEGHLNVANSTILTPFVLVGAGVLKVSSTEFAWDYGAGLNLALSPSLSLQATWRQVQQTSPSRTDNMYMGGVVWTFGATPKVVAAPAPAPVAPAPVANTQAAMLAKAQTTLKSILPAGVVLCKGNHVGNQPGCVTFEGNQMIMHLNIKFQWKKYNVQDQYGTSVQSLGNFMSAYPTTNVTLYGYASSEGSLAYNQKLSLNRAQSVKKYLVNQSNIAPSRIQTVGMGIQDPIASNATKAGRQLNRRVEATLPVPAQLVQTTN